MTARHEQNRLRQALPAYGPYADETAALIPFLLRNPCFIYLLCRQRRDYGKSFSAVNRYIWCLPAF